MIMLDNGLHVNLFRVEVPVSAVGVGLLKARRVIYQRHSHPDFCDALESLACR